MADTRDLPRRRDDRTIIHFDYDCFYASVFENQNPALKPLPVGISQKSILATCNYVARAKGVKKLSLISEAKKACPDIIIINGEDLTPFRDVSKKLFSFLRSHSWNNRVERLGLDEVFLDVSDIVAYNASLLNPNTLADSFFYLSKQDPEKGFAFDATVFAGCVYSTPAGRNSAATHGTLYRNLLLGSHLAQYLRHTVEGDFGFTASCGISTNKALSKMAGSKNKPRNQTTLLGLLDDEILQFVDEHRIRKIPGCGAKISHILENFVHSRDVAYEPHADQSSVAAGEVRKHTGITARTLEDLLGGPGAEKGIGHRIWGLLHGVDNTEVREASDVPVQISIEDSYRGLDTFAEVKEELQKLACSLVKRMRIDLLEGKVSEGLRRERWMAFPKTLRLSTRQRTLASGEMKESGFGFGRTSRSLPLPSFVFNLSEGVEQIAARLVSEALIPLFRRLHTQKSGLDLSLMNICVTNMALTGNLDGSAGGRDISEMFKRQDEVLSQWKVAEPTGENWPSSGLIRTPEGPHLNASRESDRLQVSSEEEDWEDDVEYGEDAGMCRVCGHKMPLFAIAAHQRFHDLGD